MCPDNGVAASVGLSKVYLHLVFGIFNLRKDADACDCTRGLYGQRKRVCAGKLTLGEKSLAAPGLEPASVLRLTFQSDARSTN